MTGRMWKYVGNTILEDSRTFRIKLVVKAFPPSSYLMTCTFFTLGLSSSTGSPRNLGLVVSDDIFLSVLMVQNNLKVVFTVKVQRWVEDSRSTTHTYIKIQVRTMHRKNTARQKRYSVHLPSVRQHGIWITSKLSAPLFTIARRPNAAKTTFTNSQTGQWWGTWVSASSMDNPWSLPNRITQEKGSSFATSKPQLSVSLQGILLFRHPTFPLVPVDFAAD